MRPSTPTSTRPSPRRGSPAWVVLEAPGTARAMAPSDVESDPARAFNALIALATGGNDRQEIDNRRTLQALHPGLLNRFLDAVDA